MSRQHDILTPGNQAALAWPLAAGLVSAALMLLTGLGSLLLSLLVLLSPLPLFLVGLSFGAKATAVAGGAGFVATLVAALTYGAGFVPGLLFAAMLAVPSVVLVWRALLHREGPDGREWYPMGLLVRDLAYCGLVLAVIALGLIALGGDGLVEAFAGGMQDSLRLIFPEMPEEQAAPFAAIMARVLPPFSAIGWMVMMAANLMLGQALARRSKQALRPGFDFAQMDLPNWMPVPFGLTLIAAFMPGAIGFVGLTVAAIFAVPFFLQGLAVLHVWAGRSGMPALILGLAYGVILVFGWAAVVVTMLGIVEEWAGFRARRPNEAANGQD